MRKKVVLRRRGDGKPCVIAEGEIPLSVAIGQSVLFSGHGERSEHVHPVVTEISGATVTMDFVTSDLPPSFRVAADGDMIIESSVYGMRARLRPR